MTTLAEAVKHFSFAAAEEWCRSLPRETSFRKSDTACIMAEYFGSLINHSVSIGFWIEVLDPITWQCKEHVDMPAAVEAFVDDFDDFSGAEEGVLTRDEVLALLEPYVEREREESVSQVTFHHEEVL